MKKHALSVLIVFLSIYTGIAVNGLQSPISTSSRLVTLNSPSDLDSLALVALYNQCNGVNWTKQTNWLKGPLSTWQGVIVENGRVVGLDQGDQVNSVGIIGPLPAEMVNLTEIRQLNFSNNAIAGNLPDSWSALVKLEDLRLIGDQITGSLPDSWSAMVNLKVLLLGLNQLSGTLPSSWSSLQNLYTLILSFNNLTGTLPDSWSVLTKFEAVDLSNNQLSGVLPDSWKSLINLNLLGLSNNKISGPLPESWSAFSKLYTLQLGGNQLTGSLPASWSTFVNLEILSLQENKLSGPLPESWSVLSNMVLLDLSKNQISGVFPSSWTSFVNLKSLKLNGNQISGLPSFKPFTQLNELFVQDNLLDFGSVEPNIGVPIGTFNYSPQALIGQSATLTRNAGSEFRISFPVGGQNNKYQWFKNGVLIPGANGTEYIINAVSLGDAGDYTCQITNTVATQLTLTSNPITLQIGNQIFDTVSDSLALVALYKQCNGLNWTKQTNWLKGNLNTWQGVTVENGRVVGLDLGDQNNSVGLIGQLPYDLSNLNEIRNLSFWNNKLTGTLSDSWTAFTKLQLLNLSGNQFSGTLPGSWSALVSLSELILSNNQFTGNLPESWSALSSLTLVLIFSNQLSGSLPDSWSKLSNLTNLQLAYNKLTGPLPVSWSALKNLTWLVLGGNLLTGNIPDSWNALVNMEGLWLYDNKLTGNLPSGWSAFAHLSSLMLGSNQFTGAIPQSWQSLTNLQQLYLNDNQISSVPSFSALTNLNELLVNNNMLDFGSIEPNVGIPISTFYYSPQAPVGQPSIIIKNLGDQFSTSVTVGGQHNKYQWYKNGSLIPGATGTTFTISSVTLADTGDYTCQITNTVATQLTLTSNPVTLQIGSLTFDTNSDSLALVALYKQCNGVNWSKQKNWLTGRLNTWQGVTVENGRVIILDLGDQTTSVGLTGQLPAELANLTEIKTLNLSSNQLTGALPVSWISLVNLQQLFLGFNQFTGPLPESWSSLTQLQVIYLGGNQLTGVLPSSWSALTNLNNLVLETNQFTGTIPDSWSALINLNAIGLSNNQLTGLLPASWSAFSNLQVLMLHHNKFTGTLPDSWATLTKLTQIVLDNNQLNGSLPASWSALVNLFGLSLGSNRFTGTLPDEWKTLTKLIYLTLYNNQLTGILPDSWASLVNLTDLTLFQNQLSGSLPSNWSNLVNLQTLWLHNNKLTGTLPDAWATLTKLTQLTVSDNQLTGTIPVNWAGLINLESLGIMNNQISGLPLLSALTKLKYLDAGNNLLDFGSIEPNIGVPQSNFSYTPQANVGQQAIIIKNLGDQFSTIVTVGGSHNKYQWYKNGSLIPGATGTTFTISSVALADAGDYTCQITNTVATQLTLTSNPITLQIGTLTFDTNSDSLALVALYKQCNGVNWTKQTNWLTGPLSTWQGVTLANGRVTELDLGDPYISVGLTGPLPSELSNLTEITSINLDNNKLTGNLPDSWSTLVKLQDLRLGVNQFIGNIPSNWSSLVQLQVLDLGNNQLTGSLPQSWAALMNLIQLNLSANHLSGSLPENWAVLVNMQQLWLGNNQLTGSLPSSWKALVNLKGLLLYYNQLIGSLPESWSALVNLSSLILNNNQFTGNLPVGWSTLVNLTELYLNSNKLTGPLPNSWSAFVNIQHLHLDNNQLSGNMPDSWLAMVNLTQLSLSNNQLSGIPILSTLTKLNNLSVQNNVLDFGPIEPNVPVLTGTFSYSPQAFVSQVATLIRNLGEEFRISVNVGGQSNKYQWYKNGTAIPGATSKEFLISSVTAADAAIYTCQITNTVATKLILSSNPITLQIGASGPVANAGSDQTVSMGSPVILDSSGSSHDAGKTLTFKWTAPPGILLSSTSAVKPTFIAPQVTTDTNYNFTLVVNDGTSDSSADQVIITVKFVNGVPLANAGTDQSVSEGTKVTLDGSASTDPDGNTITYKWDGPPGITLSSVTSTNPTFQAPAVSSKTDYTFSLVVNDGIADSPSVTVVVSVLPGNLNPCDVEPIPDLYLDINYKPDHLDIRHKLLTCAIPFHPDLTYDWDMGDGTTDYRTVIQHTYPISNDVMSYTLSLTVTNSVGCSRTTSRIIEVIPFIPNVFSPNGDGTNDIFMPKVKLKIFDRYGTIFYDGTDGWDGTYKGKSVEPDTYFYSIEYSDWKDKVQTRRGFITLVK